MSTKTSTVQPPGRRTPLSLNASTKQMHKPANKNDNKKETNSNNNQKTDNSKKDSQQEKRNTVEKKNASTDSRKASSDSKKVDETKTATATIEESKKSQNGVGTNGVKDKDKANTNEGAKSKSETSSAAPTSKKDSQKAAANEGAKSKTDTASVPTTPKKESQKAAAEKKEEPAPPVVVKEIKKEDNKNKEKAKKADESAEEKKNETEMKEETVAEVPETKKSDENTSDTKKIQISKTSEAPEEDNKVVDNLNSSASKDVTASVEQKVDEETATATTENKIEERSNEDNKFVSGQTDDVEMMEPLTYDDELPPVAMAASTPAKPLYSNDFLRREAKTSPKSEAKFSGMFAHTPDRKSHSRPFSAISGRRSIRPVGDYSFSGNLHIRESYRKINTELDFTSSSLNVTVGSEVPNNDSFSFFSRSRKRDRSSPSRQSAMEVQGDISPKSPKRARIDIGMSGFFSAMASPITMLRSRLARTTVQSTPKKQPEAPIDDDVVENVSGISVNEEITATEELTMNPDSTVDNAAIEAEQQKLAENDDPIASSDKPAAEGVKQEDDHKLQDIVVTAVDSQAKKKCSIM